MKYAIYKNKVGGLYSMEYYDEYDPELFEANGVLCYQNLKDRLPVVVNRMGGRHEFWDDDPSFVEIRECDEDSEPLTLDEMYPSDLEKFKYGWISPDGKVYVCPSRGHRLCAHYICKSFYGDDMTCYMDVEAELENLGFIRVVKCHKSMLHPDGTSLFSAKLVMTKPQADVLYKLGYSGHPDYQLMISKNCESW